MNGVSACRIVLFGAVLAGVILTSGCSLAGKRVTQTGWQISVINGRPFHSGDGKYLFAIYDGDLPDDSISILQLWSGRRPSASRLATE